MDQTILNFFTSQGPWAVLFVLLLWWVLKTHDEREQRLISALEKITDKLDEIKCEIGELKSDVAYLKKEV